MATISGEAALDFMFGNEWRKLNTATAERDKKTADTYKIKCGRPGCDRFACVNTQFNVLCRECADVVSSADEAEAADDYHDEDE